MKDTIVDCKKTLMRQMESNVHLLFMKTASEMRKSNLLEVLEKVNSTYQCNASFEVQDQVADQVFHKDELNEYDVEVIVDKLRVKIDHSRLFCR